jgi:hypothetical protein
MGNVGLKQSAGAGTYFTLVFVLDDKGTGRV